MYKFYPTNSKLEAIKMALIHLNSWKNARWDIKWYIQDTTMMIHQKVKSDSGVYREIRKEYSW